MPKPSTPPPRPHALATGFAFGESPRWHDRSLWLADWATRELVTVAADGRTEVALRLPAGAFQPVCMDWLHDGRLLVVSSREAILLRQDPDGSLTTHAELEAVAPGGWNEIVVDGRGNVYVDCVGFDLMAGEKFRPGAIALVMPDGAVRRVADGLAFPNGMAVTPDNSTLIVAESYAKKLTAFDIGVDGSLSNRRVWADLGEGAPDGICLDAEGAVWYATVPLQSCVRVREGGEVLQTIGLDRGGFACMLGGADRKTLFIVAQEWRGVGGIAGAGRTGQVLAVEAPAPHAGWP